MEPDAPAPPDLPLLALFTRLRRENDLPIGVDDYLLALAALRGGFGVASQSDLGDMLSATWAASLEEAAMVRRVLAEELTLHVRRAAERETTERREETETEADTQARTTPNR